MNRRKFIGTCSCCALAGVGAMWFTKNNLTSDDTQNFVVNHVEVHIAEHCNLNCKYCCHYSSIAEKEFYDLDKFEQDIKQMSRVFKKQLLDLQLLGGEPLLNPQINEYIKISRKYFPKTRIGILTNATLLDDMDEKFWKTLNENKVHILPTIYPIEINWASILEKAEKYNVQIFGNFMYREELSLDNIDDYRKNTFSRMKLTESDYNLKLDKSECQRKYGCNAMYDGKLYPCFAVAYIRHLNKKYGTKFAVAKGDYVDLYKAKHLSEVEKFLNKPQFPFCNYCVVDSGKVKWESSTEHDISEWT